MSLDTCLIVYPLPTRVNCHWSRNTKMTQFQAVGGADETALTLARRLGRSSRVKASSEMPLYTLPSRDSRYRHVVACRISYVPSKGIRILFNVTARCRGLISGQREMERKYARCLSESPVYVRRMKWRLSCDKQQPNLLPQWVC